MIAMTRRSFLPALLLLAALSSEGGMGRAGELRRPLADNHIAGRLPGLAASGFGWRPFRRGRGLGARGNGRHKRAAGSECAFEVRAFVPTLGVPEDPVTGSLNAGLAQWLIGAGLAPERYVASQGTALGRSGRVFAERVGADTWIGGHSVTCVEGRLSL